MKNKIENSFRRRLSVCLPSTLDLDTIMLDNPVSFKSNKNNAQKLLDRAKYILGQIYSARYNETRELQPENQYTNLCHQNLRVVVHNFLQYIDYFDKLGVIERDNHFYYNKDNYEISKCIGYKFTEKYFPKGTLWRKHYIYDSKIYSKRPYIINNKPEQFHLTLKEYEPLVKSYYNLNIDLNAANDTLGELYPNNPLIVDQQLEICRKINDFHLWTFSIGKTGRIYNPISNIKREVRKHFKYDGETLYELDVKNSIPFMSLVLYDNERLKNNPIINKILIDSNERIINVGKIEARINENIIRGWRRESYLYMGSYLNTPKNDHLVLSYNIQLFKQKVLNGTIYDYMAKKWNNSPIIERNNYTREFAKEKLLIIFNQPSHFAISERTVFKECFPDVLLTIERINRGYLRTKNGKGKAKKRINDLDCPFAYFTQKLESHLMLNLVALELLKKDSDFPIITLHDAIYTTESNILIVKKKIETQALILTGNPINIQIKNTKTNQKLDDNDIEYLKILEYERKNKPYPRSRKLLELPFY